MSLSVATGHKHCMDLKNLPKLITRNCHFSKYIDKTFLIYTNCDIIYCSNTVVHGDIIIAVFMNFFLSWVTIRFKPC